MPKRRLPKEGPKIFIELHGNLKKKIKRERERDNGNKLNQG